MPKTKLGKPDAGFMYVKIQALENEVQKLKKEVNKLKQAAKKDTAKNK
jgi:hypothetical protein